MSDQWTAWKATLAQAKNGPVTLPVAVRGQSYAHNLLLAGDWTASTLIGSVRASPDSGTALTEFTIGAPSFSAGVTTWAVSLTDAQTGALPADSDGDGVEQFLYDFLLNNKRLFGGLLPLSGHITEPV